MNIEDEEPKYGEPRKYDPNFKGPIQNRGCTDIICCVLFVIAIVGYVAVGILAWSQGDPRKVIYPTNSRGEFCGQVGTSLEKKPFLFYFNILKCASPIVLVQFQCPTTQLCVEQCPDRSMTLLNAKANPTDWSYYKTFCKEGVGDQSAQDILKNQLCPAVLIASKPFTRRCFPALGLKGGEITVGNQTTFVDGENKNRKASDLLPAVKNATIVIETRLVVMKIFEDYTQSWYWILIGLVIATVLSLIFIVLLRFLAGIMVWIMIIMVVLVIGYGTALLRITRIHFQHLCIHFALLHIKCNKNPLCQSEIESKVDSEFCSFSNAKLTQQCGLFREVVSFTQSRF